jgi:glycosyltransferase involved in cell wall biosynthesis
VGYLPRAAFDPRRPAEAVLAARAPELFDERPNASTTLLWVHSPDAGEALTPERAANVDRILALSAWQERNLRERHPFAADRLTRIRNAIDPSRFAERHPRERRVVCAVQPERGLDVVLETWPRVRERVPEAELACCHAPVYDFIAAASEEVRRHRRRIAALGSQPGVRALGALGPRSLAELLLRSRVWVHPAWATPAGRRFNETSCIGAMEAQAAGLWTVASRWGALPETVRVGALVDPEGAPGERWREAFVDEIVRGLTDPATQERAEREGPLAAARMGWGDVVHSLARLIDRDRAGVTGSPV